MDRSATVTRRLAFSAAHRLFSYTGPCGGLHGHNYVAEVTVRGVIGKQDMVVDFCSVKGAVGSWVDRVLDHAVLLNDKDTLVAPLSRDPANRVFIMPHGHQPTAEALGELIRGYASEALERPLKDVSIVVRETESCWAQVPDSTVC